MALSTHTCIIGVNIFGLSSDLTVIAHKPRVWRIKNKGNPQSGQKCLSDVGEEEYTRGLPFVAIISSDDLNSNPIKGAPDARWHM
jgi:hypothetical protein